MALSASIRANQVLTYGHDAVLLDTRRLLLKQAGVEIDIVTRAEEFRARLALAQPPYGLIILCHTISEAEQQQISTAAAQSNTAVYTISTPMEPPDFLRTVTTLLTDDKKSL